MKLYPVFTCLSSNYSIKLILDLILLPISFKKKIEGNVWANLNCPLWFGVISRLLCLSLSFYRDDDCRKRRYRISLPVGKKKKISNFCRLCEFETRNKFTADNAS